MVAKERAPLSSDDKRLQAEHQAEKQLAFYLGRAFGNDPMIRVFNDLRFEQDRDAAQIDHLVLSRYGFVLIESKSVRGRFVVNDRGEWARQYETKIQGIPSPVLQVKRQADFLKSYLSAGAPDLLCRLAAGDSDAVPDAPFRRASRHLRRRHALETKELAAP